MVAQRGRVEKQEKVSWVKAKQNPLKIGAGGEVERRKVWYKGEEIREEYKETKKINLETVH